MLCWNMLYSWNILKQTFSCILIIKYTSLNKG
nr:MAG TPA: hypothetical protein [Bacteriophage sp.]